jgi:hypothetical protein
MSPGDLAAAPAPDIVGRALELQAVERFVDAAVRVLS